MGKIFNRKNQLDARQRLRCQMPTPEQILWHYLKREQLGVKFRRQHGIGRYIVDFYCPEKRLVIEVDGDSHFSPDSRNYDHSRDEYLMILGISVLRFTNLQVMQQTQSVLEGIKQVLDASITPPRPSP